MKEIKFKQPITNNKGKFESWHYWGILSKGVFIAPLTNTESNQNESYQFTGLKDKNGKEIYEEDIIKNKGLIQKIYFEIDESCYKVKCLNCYDKNGSMLRDLRFLIDKEIEVIGNKFENPELLK